MKVNFKFLMLILLISNITIIFADNDWINYPTENKKIYPIIFGRIEDPNNSINLNESFNNSTFFPNSTSGTLNFETLKNGNGSSIIFYSRYVTDNKPIFPIISNNFFTYYKFSSTLHYSDNQSLPLNFIFRQS